MGLKRGDTIFVGGTERDCDFITELHPFIVTAKAQSRIFARIKNEWVEGFPMSAEFPKVGFMIRREAGFKHKKFMLFNSIEEYEEHQKFYEGERKK